MPGVPLPGGNIHRKFTTRAFATGVPTTLAGTPAVSIYKDNSLTQSTTGVTLTVDFDSVTGLNHVAIDTSADATFYSIGSTYYLVITAGTVGGTSVVGEVVGEFELGISNYVVRQGTAQAGNANWIRLDASASATNNLYVGLQVAILGGTGIGQVRTITNYTGNNKQCTVDRPFITAPDSTSVFALLPADAPALNATLQVSAGTVQIILRTGTAQAGSTANTIVLDAGAPATNNIFKDDLVTITGGTGLGQTRTIISYNGTTKVATVDSNWTTTPDGTSTFAIVAAVSQSTYLDQGVAQAGGASTITLAATSSTVNDIYKDALVTILSGTGAGQTATITGYVGSTHVATVDAAWSVQPDTTSAYAVLPFPGQNSGSSLGVVTANVTQINGVAAPGDGLGHLDVRLADGVAHGGTPGSSTSTIACQQLNATNPVGSAIVGAGAAGSAAGLDLTGVIGLRSVGAPGGETYGAYFGNGPNATTTPAVVMDGFYGTGGSGLKIVGAGGVEGLWVTGNYQAPAVKFEGGDTGGGFAALLLQAPTISGTIQLTNGVATENLWSSFFLADSGTTYSSAVAGSVVKEIASNAGGGTDPWTTNLSTYSTPGTAGFILRTLNPDSSVIYSSTLPSQSGVAANAVKLDSGASAADGAYVGDVASATSGTGQGGGIVLSYTGSTRTAIIHRNWSVQPVGGDVVQITPTGVTTVAGYLPGSEPDVLTWSYGTRTLTAFGFTVTIGALPAIPTNWITANGINAGALNGKGDWPVGKTGYSLDLTQTLSSPRSMSGVADTSVTMNDAMHCAVASAAGQETIVGTTYTVKTSNGTTIRAFTLDSASAPKSRT